MTGPTRDEDEQHLVVHWDASVGAPELRLEESYEPPPEPVQPSLWARHRYGIVIAFMLVTIVAAAYALGAATYHPSSRLPALVFGTEEPLFGTNALVASEIDIVRQTFGDVDALSLQPVGRVFHVPLPRTLADRIWGRRDEAGVVFAVSGPTNEYRFFVLTEGGKPRIFAVEAPLGLTSLDQPTGIFLALDPSDPGLGPLVNALDALLPSLADLEAVEFGGGELYIFGPYAGPDPQELQARVADNTVMAHLAQEIELAGGNVSAAAPAFLVTPGARRGTINGLYHSTRRLIMAPLWGDASTATLAHELVHAHLDTAVDDKQPLLSMAADYLERAHPVLHGRVVGDLYERLGREGRAEETLAFIVGAIAAQQTKTMPTERLLENPGNLAISEAIFYSDIHLLVQIGLLPPCMRPDEGSEGEITHRYYQMVEAACR